MLEMATNCLMSERKYTFCTVHGGFPHVYREMASARSLDQGLALSERA